MMQEMNRYKKDILQKAATIFDAAIFNASKFIASDLRFSTALTASSIDIPTWLTTGKVNTRRYVFVNCSHDSEIHSL